MPELPEVETIRRSLIRSLVGRRLERVAVRERRLRQPVDPAALRRHALGRRVEDVSRRGKYLLVHLEGERRLLIHLGMTGTLLLVPRDTPLAEHVHVVFGLDGARDLRFRDHRRFGLIDAMPASALGRDRRLRGLGVEPLSPEASGAYFYARSRGVRRSVKSFLMDGREVVGVGNIYASEALHLAGVHPARAAGRLGLARWERLTWAVKRVLREAIRQGGTTLSDFRSTNGDAGSFQVFLRVYDREGEPCRGCGSPVRRRVLGGRSTFYCARCQR